jgi:hypothetical protein
VLAAFARAGDPDNRGAVSMVTAFRATFQSSLRVRADRRKHLPILPREQWLSDSEVEAIASAIGLDMCMWKSTGGGRASIMSPEKMSVSQVVVMLTTPRALVQFSPGHFTFLGYRAPIGENSAEEKVALTAALLQKAGELMVRTIGLLRTASPANLTQRDVTDLTVDSDAEDPLPGRLHTVISEEIAPQGAPSASSGPGTDSG